MNADAAMNNSAATSAEPFAMGECTADASIASPTPMIAYVMGITPHSPTGTSLIPAIVMVSEMFASWLWLFLTMT